MHTVIVFTITITHVVFIEVITDKKKITVEFGINSTCNAILLCLVLFKVLHITYTILHSAVQCRDAAGRDGSRGERGGKEKRKQDAQTVHIEHYMKLEGNTHMHTCPVLDACMLRDS